MTRPYNTPAPVGRRFGNWRVTGEGKTVSRASTVTGRVSRKRHWRCVCACGLIRDVSRSQLLNGGSTQCVMCRDGVRRKGDYGLYARAKRGAKTRSIPWRITMQQFLDQFAKQGGKCALTGVELQWPKGALEANLGRHTASLDRIDSSRGYTADNIQWVHKFVNMLKGKRTDAELIHWARLIAAHADAKGNES